MEGWREDGEGGREGVEISFSLRGLTLSLSSFSVAAAAAAPIPATSSRIAQRQTAVAAAAPVAMREEWKSAQGWTKEWSRGCVNPASGRGARVHAT